MWRIIENFRASIICTNRNTPFFAYFQRYSNKKNITFAPYLVAIMALKIPKSSQIKTLDAYTIAYEPISSIALMERAATALFLKIKEHFHSTQTICILAGFGNNGGDALALARMLSNEKWQVQVCLICGDKKLSPDCETNYQKFKNEFPENIVSSVNDFKIAHDTLIIDGLFGVGLNREITGEFAEAIHFINAQQCTKIAIDIPSGLQGEQMANESTAIVRADYTFTFQFPKLAFMFHEHEQFVGNWDILDIQLHPDAIAATATNLYFTQANDAERRVRKRFSHKGTHGHLLCVVGSMGMAGAGIFAAKAALRTGAGLLTVHAPECNRIITQIACPEAMFVSDKNENGISNIEKTENFTAFVIGCGIGTNPETQKMLELLLERINKPCVLDADALNIIAKNPHLLTKIPHESIITPHPKEFERLFGKTQNSLEQLELATKKAKELNIYIVLKGANSRIVSPNGEVNFNSTGNAGMATAGMGDALAGIIGGLLAQGYEPQKAATMGVYLHGEAADKAVETKKIESLITSDLLEHL